MMRKNGMSQAELARRTGVSRQAVSLWLKSPQASVSGEHLLKVSRALGISAERLAQPLPGFGAAEHDELMAAFLWDRLYADLDEFALAINAWEPPAVARLVQVSGIYVAARLLGPRVWRRFGTYKRYLHPVRRQQLEGLVRWRMNQTAT